MKKIVVVGGVAGGASFAARFRRLDEQAEIILLERGYDISYANCGLPYHIGHVIEDQEDLRVQSPIDMKQKFNIDVRVRHEVLEIDREHKKVLVKKLNEDTIYEETYDYLILATGSSPIRPNIEGIDAKRIQTLWTIEDASRIRSMVQQNHFKHAVVIGGGFIGLEMVENLHTIGLSVDLIEASSQVMGPVDAEMAEMIHAHLREKGVKLHVSDGVVAFQETTNEITTKLQSGKQITADFVILAIGVKPNSELALRAGLKLNARKGIVVDAHMKTEDDAIYALGDVIGVEDFTLKEMTMIPLAGPANKQGRIVANHINGRDDEYQGTQGTSIVKVFDLSIASTGVNEKNLQRKGLCKGIDFETVIITQNSHASYYPGALPMTIKLLFAKDGSKIYGAQIVGYDGVDKRIDTLSMAIRMHATIRDLTRLELAYAPPFSSAKDPINMVGYVAENVIDGLVRFSEVDIEREEPGTILLDVREQSESNRFAIPNAHLIPLKQLRKQCHTLEKEKPIIVFCAVGVRAYLAARILQQNGFQNVKVYPSGTYFYKFQHHSS